MAHKLPSRMLRAIFILYLTCYAIRLFEYLVLRTDQSIWGEAFLHKAAGLFLLAAALRYFSLRWRDIGFSSQRAGALALFGLATGALIFGIAYGLELLILSMGGAQPQLQIYVTSYALGGNLGRNTGLVFFLICIAGNLLNVAMEEGVFRGLFVRLLLGRTTFFRAALLSSLLFGLWHAAAPLRGLLDGTMSPVGATISALVLILTTFLGGLKFCLLTKLTGSLWMPMADHFVNNTVINVLHVVTLSGADGMQTLRITVAQTLSFLMVLLLYRWTGARTKETFRTAAPYI